MANSKGNSKNLSRSGQGRPKGSKNKFTNLKQAFIEAFEEIGGTEELTRWAKRPENQRLFYAWLARMLPKEIELSNDPKNSKSGVVILPDVNVISYKDVNAGGTKE